MSRDLAFTTMGMTNLNQSSGLVRTGLFSLQAVLSSFVGSTGLIALSVGVMAVTSLFTKKAEATKLAREELDKNKSSVKDNSSALAVLIEHNVKYARSIYEVRIAEMNVQLSNMKDLIIGASQRLDQMATGIINVAESEKIATDKAADLQAELIRMQEALENIDKTKAKIRIEGIEGADKERLKKFNEDLQKILNPPAKPSIQLEFKDAKEGVDKFKQSVIITTGKIQAMNNTTALLEPIWDENSRKAEEFKNATSRYVGDLSTAFADMMMGVDVRWGDLLESMVKQLIASGIQSLIMGLLTGGVGGGLLGGIFGGFQSGTPFVPRTGAYILHQGEAVIPANQNVYRSSVFNQQSNYGNTYVQIIQLDPKKLTKDKIAPILKEMIKNREFNI
jgi:hypothetical protein